MNREVVILGAGISGLVAGHALEELGVPFRIIDRGPAEALPRLAKGCVYFHDRCNLPPERIRQQTLMTAVLPYTHVKTAATLYHEKIWGDRPYVSNSVERVQYAGTIYTTVYSMNDALTYLTDRYWDRIEFGGVDRTQVMWLAEENRVISTIPFPILAPTARCESTPLYIWQGAIGRGVEPEFGDRAYVLYNVDPKALWYRMASMFGYFSMEFVAPPEQGWVLERYAKIITSPDAVTFMDAHPNILLTGRWGRWQRGALGHEAHRDVKAAFTTGRWA